MRVKILIALNSAWNVINFRSGLIRSMVASGYEVVVVAPSDKYADKIELLGCRYIVLDMHAVGTNPGRDLMLLYRYIRILQLERPDIFLGYTIKPNIYGSWAAHFVGIPVINNITGLGAVFTTNNWLTKLVGLLYKITFARSAKVFFQNEDDRQQFLTSGLIRREISDRLPGSGIDLEWFQFSQVAKKVSSFRFLLIARMLWNKGIREFVDAARRIKKKYPRAEFCLLGPIDVQNPAAIMKEQVVDWVNEGVVKYLGDTHDVRPMIASANCVVLPSYREGTPRTLLEAGAMGRPVITTNSVGCKDTVDDGLNGYLCKVRDSSDLAEKMDRILLLTDEQRAAMGCYGRKKMESEYDEHFVIDRYLVSIGVLLKNCSATV